MNKGVILCSLGLALLAAPLVARAAANADFDEDAKPLLRQQPGLLNYVKAHFEVKETGKAKYPGDDDHRPGPPYIFRARERGSGGPYNISLLIQPGPPGRILCVVPPANSPQAPAPQQQEPQPQPFQAQSPAQTPYQSPSLSQGEVKPLPPEQQSQTPAPAPQQTPAQQPAPPSGPTSDTPSGPILPNSSSTGTATNPQQNLAPPPDPAPANQ